MQKLHQYLPGTVQERIQDFIKERKITQAILAKEIDIPTATLSRYLSADDVRIPHDAILKMAKYFNVSTDFLLCETDISYRTNYDIQELGLTAKAAAKLYSGQLSPVVVSMLIENPHFTELTKQIELYLSGTFSAAMASYNQVMDIAAMLLKEQAQVSQKDAEHAKKAMAGVQELVIPNATPDMSMVHITFDALLDDLKSKADEQVQKSKKLTSNQMMAIIQNMKKRQGDYSLSKVTPDVIVDAITETLVKGDDRPETRCLMKEQIRNLFMTAANLDKESQVER